MGNSLIVQSKRLDAAVSGSGEDLVSREFPTMRGRIVSLVWYT